MVTCSRRQTLTMLPLVPINPFNVASKPSPAASVATTTIVSNQKTVATTATMHSKPKLAFSIDALVGGERKNDTTPSSPVQRLRIIGPPRLNNNSPPNHHESQEPLELRSSRLKPSSSTSPPPPPLHLNRTTSVINRPIAQDSDPPETGNSPIRECSSRDRTQSPLPATDHPHSSRSTTPLHSPREATSPTDQRLFKTLPTLPPGLVRPFPLPAPGSLPLIRPPDGQPSNLPPLLGHTSSNPLMPPSPTATAPTSNPHLLAAQFQMAAVLAHHQQQQQQQQHHQAGPHGEFFSKKYI